MADMTELKNIVRKGIVHSVDKAAMKARVKFPDKGGIISGDLFILITPRYIVPAAANESGNKVADKSLSYDKSDTLTTESHTHAAYLTNWVPEIGSMVLCLMIPDGDGEGYILGGVK